MTYSIGYSTWGYHVYAAETGSRLGLDLVWGEVARAGYRGIEICQALEDLPPAAECRRILDHHGIAAISHWVSVTFDRHCLEEAERRARFVRDVGGAILVCEGERQPAPLTKDQRSLFYDRFDAIGRVCERLGVQAAFHFHRGCLDTEQDVDDFFAHTQAVRFCPDIGHAAAVGWDPIPVLRRHRDKLVLVHLKDARRDPGTGAFERFVELGQGNSGLDIEGCLDRLAEDGYRGWALVEQDQSSVSPSADALVSRRYLETIGRWAP